jgi:hypothetical protein
MQKFQLVQFEHEANFMVLVSKTATMGGGA